MSDGQKNATERDQKLKADLIKRLNRIEGQVRGIKAMIERDEYCDDVLHQTSAVASAMSSVSKLVLENHIRTCVVNKIIAHDSEIVEELIKTIGKVV